MDLKQALGRAGHSRWTKVTAIGIGVLVVAGVGWQAMAASSTDADRYRLVTLGSRSIEQTLTATGTVSHISQVALTFPTSGLVASVDVKAGESVQVGQQLAALATTPLQTAVVQAEAAYLAAVAELAVNTASNSSSSGSSSEQGSSSARTSSASEAPTTGASARATEEAGQPTGQGQTSTRPSQGEGTDTSTDLDIDVAGLTQPLMDALSAISGQVSSVIEQCQGAAATVTVTATSTVTVTVDAEGEPVEPSPSSTASPSSSADAPAIGTAAALSGSKAVSAQCQAAVDELSASRDALPGELAQVQTGLTQLQHQLEDKAAALTAQAAEQSAQAADLTAQAAALQARAAKLQQQISALQAQAQTSAAQASSVSGGSGAAGSRSASVTAATLITDRAEVESTRVALQQARDTLAGAVITAPIAGTIASMPFVAGQTASAQSELVIIGSGAVEVSVPISITDLPAVVVGQQASVSTPTDSAALSGVVTRIGLLPSTSSTGAATGTDSTASQVTYPVTVLVASGGDSFAEGTRVSTAIVTARVDAAVALPASALTPTDATSGTVRLVSKGTSSTRTITTGARGSGWIEVVEGLSAGDQVAVADLTEPLPGASSSSAATAAPQDMPPGMEAGGGGMPAGGGAPGGGQGGAQGPR